MDKSIHILIVEDIATDAELIEMELSDAGVSFTSTQIDSKEAFIKNLKGSEPDVIISDYTLPRFNALEALQLKNELWPTVPFILVTGAQTEEIAVACIKAGADDYILKSSLTRLPTSVLNAIRKKRAERERRKALEQLQAREEKYRNLFENSVVGMFRARLQNSTFIEANEKAKSILGVTEIEGLSVGEVFCCSDDLLAHLVVEQPNIENLELEVTRGDGSKIWISVSAKLYEQEDIIEGVFHDITHKKNSYIEMERANYELDRFVYHASHDLKSPLKSLEGLVMAALEEDDLGSVHLFLKMMQKSIFKLDTLISDLLALARNKKTEASIVSVDFEKEVKESLSQLTFMDHFNKIEFKLSIHQESEFYTDAVRLRIILNNIISNSIKYHRLNQESPFVEIKIQSSHNKAFITIEDNGQGIDDKHLSQIFEMFYRATSSEEGTGLGLYLVKGTILKLKGSISVTSQKGLGSSFDIELPNSKSV